MDASQEALLLNGADCPLHHHSQDRAPTHETLNGLNEIEKQVTVSTPTYTVAFDDDLILVSVTSTLTLPPAKNGKKLTVVKLFSGGSVTIDAYGAETISGAATASISTQWDVKRLKALLSGGWVLV